MQNPNHSSETRNGRTIARPSTSSNSSNSNTRPFVSSRIGDVPMFGRENHTHTQRRFRHYQGRSFRRSATSQGHSRRRNIMNLSISRRILGLSLEARRFLLSAIADALQIEGSPTDDRVTYNIELNVPNSHNPSLYERDYEYPVNHVNRNNAELNNTLVGNSGGNSSWSGVLNVFRNLFQRNSSSDNRDV